MPSFFHFQQGSDTRSLPSETESLRYGRFRAFPAAKRAVGSIFEALGLDGSDLPVNEGSRSRHTDYGSIRISSRDGRSSDEEEEEKDERWWLDRIFISPRRPMVEKMIETWWRRTGVLVLLPAGIVIAWCAIPFPTSPLDLETPNTAYSTWSRSSSNVTVSHRQRYESDSTTSLSILPLLLDALGNVFDFSVIRDMISSFFHHVKESTPLPIPSPGNGSGNGGGAGGPGHGEALVKLNFWFFLIVYYGFYNLVGLLWVTKLFNLYSLNWWPPRLGFPPAFTLFNIIPLLIAIPLYYVLPPALINNNLSWILLTFTIMSCPVLIAFLVLLSERRSGHIGVRQGLSDTQLIFSTSPSSRRFLDGDEPTRTTGWRRRVGRRNGWGLARSYVRFFWFCGTLLLSLVGLVLGEAYSEVYLTTLPHNSLETVVYVWSWVATIHLLDATTGWVLGARVGSYPLEWVFKLYFGLIYQTYVRAIYARLRSPSQFAYLQLLSSSIVVLYQPLSMTKAFHRTMILLGINGQDYEEYKKYIGRSFYVRGLAENVSMVAWLGWVAVLHYGANTKVYPYFSFSDKSDPYTFELTFFASLATWGCEIIAGWAVRRIMKWGFGFNVTKEALQDFKTYPELMPACLAVMVHVLQNMLFSIIRMRFY
ncbi:hypothetical protein RUND412_001550 [Rhizina undulata]